jgi:putative spermidine/putrescine transport system permease protein
VARRDLGLTVAARATSRFAALLSPPFVLVAPATLLIGGLYAFALLRVLWLSVSEPSLGLDNYRLLLTNETIHRVAWTTLWICSVATAVTVMLGYVIAYAMVHAAARERRLILFCVLLTFWLSVLVRTFAWIVLLRNDGLVNQLLEALGLIDEPLALVRNSVGVIIGMVHVMSPLAILPLYAALRGIDPSLIAAARGLGCGPIRSFLYVFLPLSRPGLAAATLLVFVFSLGFYVTPAILGGGRVLMVAEYIRVQFEQTLRWGLAAMMATALLVTVFLILGLAMRAANVERLIEARR